MNYATMNKPELIKILMERGHRHPFLVRMGVPDLRKMAESGKTYDGPPQEKVQQERTETVPQAPQKPQTPQEPKTLTDTLADALTETLAPIVTDRINEKIAAKVERITREIAEKNTKNIVRELTIKIGEKQIDMGVQHKDFTEILEVMVGTMRPVYLYGPAGSGKSTLAKNLAKALSAHHGEDIAFEFSSFGPASQMHELTGIPPFNGNPAQISPFWRAWTRPSVILLDELDAAPELFVQLNNALANNVCYFADGQRYEKHPLCYVIAAGNTVMSGATDHYTSRARQDKATIDRFIFWEFAYDEVMERALTGNDKWAEHVQKLRKALVALGANAPDVLITPRASIHGAELLRAKPDWSFERVEKHVIWRGIGQDEIDRVRRAAGVR